MLDLHAWFLEPLLPETVWLWVSLHPAISLSILNIVSFVVCFLLTWFFWYSERGLSLLDKASELSGCLGYFYVLIFGGGLSLLFIYLTMPFLFLFALYFVWRFWWPD